MSKEETTVYPLKTKEIQELHRLLNTFTVFKIGLTDKGKMIIKYGDHFGQLQLKVLNP